MDKNNIKDSYNEGFVSVEETILPIHCVLMDQIGFTNLADSHYHKYTEILFGVDCDATTWIGGQSYHFYSGDMLVINSDEIHTIFPNTSRNKYIVVKFVPDILLAGANNIYETKYTLPFIEKNTQHKKLFLSSEIKNTNLVPLFWNIVNEYNSTSYGHEMALKRDIISICHWLLSYWHYNAPEDTPSHSMSLNVIQSMQQAINYIEENFPIANASKIAQMCNLSYCYFLKAFRAYTKKSFNNYVVSFRLNEAKKLLMNTNLSVTEVALEVGFSTTNHFITLFKAENNVTPKQFKMHFKKNPDYSTFVIPSRLSE